MTATWFCPVAIWTIKDTESFHGGYWSWPQNADKPRWWDTGPNLHHGRQQQRSRGESATPPGPAHRCLASDALFSTASDMATTVHHFGENVSISGTGGLVSWQYGRFKLYGVYWRLTILTGKYGYLVGVTPDGTYAPGDNSNCPGSIQVPGQDQHKNGHLHMHSAVLLALRL